MSSAPVCLQSVFDFDKVSFEKDTEVHLDVTLTAPERTETKRIPLHLILAIDCSGSMNGGKLSQVKTTVGKLVDHLTENDSLGIIAFSDNVWEVLPVLSMSGENKKLAKNKVQALQSMSMTNLSGAMGLALEKAAIADTSKTCRAILLTDGLPTAGVCDKNELINLACHTNQRVSLSTFGYGDDFDAELMASISKMGRGNNFYIKSDDECNKAFALELGGLLSLYGQNIKLTISPSGNMTFKEMLSDYKCDQKQGFRLLKPGVIEILIDDIFVGEKKHCVMKLEIPKATEAVCARATKVCDISMTYIDTETQKEVIVTEAVRINYVKADKVASEPDPEVKKQLLIFEVARLQKEAKDKADAGDYKGAQIQLGEAVTFVNTHAQLIPDSGAYVFNLQNLSDNFVDSDKYRSKGVRSAAAFSRCLYSNRASSGDSVGMAYSNNTLTGMLKSFSGEEASAAAGVVGIGNAVVQKGTLPLETNGPALSSMTPASAAAGVVGTVHTVVHTFETDEEKKKNT
jgi:Ca-activated chloride channel family protein